MATIPTVPSFTFEEAPSISVLGQLAACATFIGTLPAYAVLSGGITLANATTTPLAWTTRTTDRDGGWSSGSNTRYTAQTGGYYLLQAGVSFAASTTGPRLAYFQVTTGSSNPGGAGNTTIFGDVATTPVTSANPTRLDLAATSPYLYAGDYLQVIAYQASGGSLATSSNMWTLSLLSLGP